MPSNVETLAETFVSLRRHTLHCQALSIFSQTRYTNLENKLEVVYSSHRTLSLPGQYLWLQVNLKFAIEGGRQEQATIALDMIISSASHQVYQNGHHSELRPSAQRSTYYAE